MDFDSRIYKNQDIYTPSKKKALRIWSYKKIIRFFRNRKHYPTMKIKQFYILKTPYPSYFMYIYGD